MRVLFITSEIDDFVQVGGLAAVSAALPRALKGRADVRILIPGYRSVIEKLPDLRVVGSCPAAAALPACDLALASTSDGLSIYVIVCPELYDRSGNPYTDVYGKDWADNDLRFARLALVGALLAEGRVDPEWHADLVHVNDWQSALTPAYLKWRGSDVASILTIHNLAYQGVFGRDTLRRIAAPESSFNIDGTEFYGKVSFLKAGCVYASHLTTVSATYAQEITTPEMGCGLDGLLRKRSEQNELTGILNGIDQTWDASTCRHLPAQFAPGDWAGKRSNTEHLRKEFGLSLSDGPLFGVVARLVHQKGLDLVIEAADTIVSSGGQLVVMGRGEPQLEDALSSVSRRHPGEVAVAIRFDDAEARRVFAGSDFTLMPSRFEPCGLSQMYAQRFGSLPIGHRTGGLSETIKDGKTGFLFDRPMNFSFLGAICRAFGTYARQTMMNAMREAAMGQDFQWQSSAASYRDLYTRLS